MKIEIDIDGLTLADARAEFEKQFLQHRYREHAGNMTATAQSVGMARAALDKKFRLLGISGLTRAVLKAQAAGADELLKPGAARRFLKSIVDGQGREFLKPGAAGKSVEAQRRQFEKAVLDK